MRKRAELLQVGYQVGCLGPIRHLESVRLAVGQMHHSLRGRGSRWRVADLNLLNLEVWDPLRLASGLLSRRDGLEAEGVLLRMVPPRLPAKHLPPSEAWWVPILLGVRAGGVVVGVVGGGVGDWGRGAGGAGKRGESRPHTDEDALSGAEGGSQEQIAR